MEQQNPDGSGEASEPLDDSMEAMEGALVVSQQRAQRFYDRLRRKISAAFSARGGVKGKAGELLLFVPDIFILLWRLTTDGRVSAKNKVLLGTGVAYFIFPFDFVPDFLPIGYLDDLVFAVYILNKLLSETDHEIIRENWSGSEDVLDVIRRVLDSADKLVGSDVLKQIKRLFK
jgi:uncharacterized membrane protein YkvA (DUF1232 family)